MEIIISTVAQILGPLSLGIVATAIFGGLFLGAIYNGLLNIPDVVVFHKLVAGIVFLTLVFCYRAVTALVSGTAFPMVLGWVGIGILWTIFCGSIYIGRRAIRAVNKRLA